MSARSENAIVAVVGGLILILLLVVGAGFYIVTKRHEAELIMQAQAERQVAIEAQMAAERGRTQALTLAQRAELAGASNPSQEQEREIREALTAVLNTQADAWNRGDVDSFMEHYWKSKDLTFSSGGKTTRGWDATLARYHERYPTKEKMGHLTFSDLEITPLSDSAAMVLGRWHLERESEPVGGNYTLVLRKIDGSWVIVHDHTSQLADEMPPTKDADKPKSN